MSFIFRSTIAATAAASLALFFSSALPADAAVGVTINGNPVQVEPPPITQAGRVFVPLRGVFEQLGASVVYDDGQINATGNGRNISLHIGSTQATVDGQPQTIDVAPFIVGASTFVPLRFISESLGASVDWNDADSTVAITLAGAPQSGDDASMGDDEGAYADQAPPAIPDYDQPPVPAPNEIWQPGYWAWGANGYYWVPGTWVEPPQTGYLWTPGYWQYDQNRYAWNAGYWALAVGFYGGVNYGAGYYGNGYVGGRWSNDTFRYNTSVTHVDTTRIRNVYVDRTVIVNNTTNVRVSFNGGPRGVQARPTAQQQTVAHTRHIAMTPAQQQHVQTAAHDPRLLATVNHNVPPVMAVARPLTTTNRPAATPAYHAPAAAAPAPAYHAPAAAPAPAYREPEHRAPATAPAAPEHRAPAAAPAPAYHAPAAAPAPAYHAPEAAPAPAYHAPAAAPERRAPAVVPAYRAPAVAPAPAYHAPAAPPVRAAPERAVPPPPHQGAVPAEHRPAPKDEPTKGP
jgi:hypothetical protein